MAKGSQLTQLKTALSQAGVTSRSKKRKHSVSTEQEKDKRAAQLDGIQRRLNPFDVKVTKLKHDVGGRKLKGITGKPAQSKQAGIENRKKTLLKEYDQKGRTGGIIDRRFGENDPTMSLEERMLERFTKERQRSSRGTAFNLENDDDDDLTHYGQSLSKLDDFDNIGHRIDSDDEGETSGQLGREIVSKTHFGGFGEEGPRKKSKAEVMAEVMAKSKEHKLRRQSEQEQDDNIRHGLDDQFTALRELIYAPDPSSSGSNSIPLGTREVLSGSLTNPDMIDDGDYDQHVRELAFDKRSKPKDRTKTEEELALEEKEALEKAERRRRRRMLGQNESDSEEEGTVKGKKRKRGADDLDDDFDDEGPGVGLEQTSAPLSPAETEEGSETSESEPLSDGDEISQHSYQDIASSSKEKSKEKAAKHELPFTFPCPGSHAEFLEIIEEFDDEDVPTVVQRIRTLYHTSLGADNKFKLQTLAAVLIDHVLFVASSPTPRFQSITSLFPHILAISRAYPMASAQYCNLKLALMHKNLTRGLARGALRPEAKTWPGLAELFLLRIIGLIWPTSDLNHAVVSPTRILLGAYLGLGRVRSLSDIGSGIFLCTLFLQFEVLSKRFVPEAVNFLVNSVLHLAPHRYEEISALPGSFSSPDFRSELCRCLCLSRDVEKGVVAQKPDLFRLVGGRNLDEQCKVDLLGIALNLLGRFGDMYKAVDGFVELYEPILDILENIQSEYLPDGLGIQLSKLIDLISRLVKFSHQARKPLLLQSHKPIPIATYIPKFETTSRSTYFGGDDPDHERKQASKLRKEYKQERKGAIRELRKDARFLAGVEQKKGIERDGVYRERMRRVFGSIEGERAEEKVLEREKARDKRRAGKK